MYVFDSGAEMNEVKQTNLICTTCLATFAPKVQTVN